MRIKRTMKLSEIGSISRGIAAIITVAVAAWLGLLGSGGRAKAEDPPPGLDAENHAFSLGLKDLTDELLGLLHSQETNLRSQREAWPTRVQDQIDEEPIPPRVRHLVQIYVELESLKRGVQWQIDWELSKGEELKWLNREATASIDSLLDLLESAREPQLIVTLLPTLVKHARKSVRVVSMLEKLASRTSPCPNSVVQALADLKSDRSAGFLFSLGVERLDPNLILAAGNCGVPSVIEAIVDSADRSERSFAKMCRSVVARLVPFDRRDKIELKRLIVDRIENVNSEALRASLVSYLGLFRDPEYLTFLQHVEETAVEKSSVRLAAIGALGNLGSVSGDYLIERLNDPYSPLSVRRACLHSLGSSKHVPATPYLIGALEDPDLRRDAWRSLRRLTGLQLGPERSRWIRWWRMQDEAGDDARDPEDT